MNMFEEIEQAKKELPRFASITKDVSKKPLNGYQKFSLITFAVCFFLGILFGNLFPACGATNSLYGNQCLDTEFNFSLMIFFWFISFLVCLFFYAIGHIIALLTAINEKLK